MRNHIHLLIYTIKMLEFLKSNWGILVPVAIAIIGIIAMYNLHNKRKREEKEKEEKKFKDNISERISKIEGKIDLPTKLYPQLKSLEKLENFEKLQLSPEDISKTVTEILKTTNITPEAIDVRIEEKIKKKFSKIDENIATVTSNLLNEIDKRFKKPIGSPSDYLMLGNVEYKKANFTKAIEFYEKAIEIKPDFALAWNNKGVTLDDLNRLDEALKAYEKTIEIKPDDVKAWDNKGVTLGKLDRHDEALKSFEKTIEIKPDDAEAWDHKGVALAKLNKLDEALKAHEKAIEIKPDFAEAWYNKGVTLDDLNRLDEALKAYEKAIEIKPDYAEAWYNRACVYSLKGEKEKALSNLEKAIKMDMTSKQEAKKDEDFKNLWDDPDFKKLVE